MIQVGGIRLFDQLGGSVTFYGGSANITMHKRRIVMVGDTHFAVISAYFTAAMILI